MTGTVPVPVRYVVGSRRLFEVPRALRLVSFTLEQLIAGEMPDFSRESDPDDGLRILSAPQRRIGDILGRFPRHVMGGLQSYRRHYITMDGDFASYMNGFSGKTRSTMKRKQRRLAELSGGALDVAEYRTSDEIAEFLHVAIPLSRLTYQSRLLGSGLPEDAASRRAMLERAAADNARAFIMRVEGRAVAYLYLPVQGATLIYDHLGYDPAFAQYSPGTVLQLAALERLFLERRYRYFDFTEGEGAHKEMFGTDAQDACSFFLLRPTVKNLLLMKSLDAFDRTVSSVKDAAHKSGMLPAARRLLKA